MTYRITLRGTRDAFLCTDRQTVLAAMAQLGRTGIPLGCRGGGCGICKVHVERGQGDYLPMSRQHVSPEDEARGEILACCLVPRTDMVLSVIGKMAKAWAR